MTRRAVQILVPAIVFVLLLIVFRKAAVSLYLILSVLFSYLATLGATFLVFRLFEGPAFLGLDWKVPLFLFTILVAVGEDYNIFLMTRVEEEQRNARPGPGDSLRACKDRTDHFHLRPYHGGDLCGPVRGILSWDEGAWFRPGCRGIAGHADRPAHPGSDLYDPTSGPAVRPRDQSRCDRRSAGAGRSLRRSKAEVHLPSNPKTKRHCWRMR